MLGQQGMMRPFNVAGQRPAVMGYPQGMGNPMLGQKGFPGGMVPGGFGGKGMPMPQQGFQGKGAPGGGAPMPQQGARPPQAPREQQLTAQMLAQAPPGMQK